MLWCTGPLIHRVCISPDTVVVCYDRNSIFHCISLCWYVVWVGMPVCSTPDIWINCWKLILSNLSFILVFCWSCVTRAVHSWAEFSPIPFKLCGEKRIPAIKQNDQEVQLPIQELHTNSRGAFCTLLILAETPFCIITFSGLGFNAGYLQPEGYRFERHRCLSLCFLIFKSHFYSLLLFHLFFFIFF